MSSEASAAKGTARALADEAYDLVQVDPTAAASLSERALGAARSAGDTRAEVVALHALSWSQHVLGDIRAERTAREGILVARRNRDRRGVALLRRRLALTLAFEGEIAAARREIDAAIADLSGADAARSEVFRVAIHRSAHAPSRAVHQSVLRHAARALRRLRRDEDAIWEARLLYNRGRLFLDRGELDAAEADLRRAGLLYDRVGARSAAADAILVGAEIAFQRGDVVEYLRVTDDLRSALPTGGLAVGVAEFRASALTQARLLPEAQAAAEEYLELCARTGRGDYLPAGMLDLASIAILSGDAETAIRMATSAARSLARRGKPVGAALARLVAVRAHLLDGRARRSSLRHALDAAALLETAGWRRHALRARVLAARVALTTGSRAAARQQLELARPLGRSGTALDRIELAYARGLLRLSDGDEVGADHALRSGLALLDDYRAGLGAVELRATASGIGSELAQLGLRIAVRSDRPDKVLAWAERLRGNALRLPPARPVADLELRALLAELRRLGKRIRKAEESGTFERSLAAQQDKLEGAIRERARHARGGSEVRAPDARPREVGRALGARALVEYVDVEGQLCALTLVRGRLALQELGVIDAEPQLEWLRFALGQLNRRGTSPGMRAAALASGVAAADALDRLLVQPLLPVLGEAPLVISPTGSLHALPWAALRSLRARPIVVAPSLSMWLELEARPRSRRRRLMLAAGPRLRHSAAEVRALSPILPNAAVLSGSDATVAATLAAFDGARLAHVACHGRFRADSPLFSSLELADGPLTALDLQQLERVPETLILSSCDLALSEAHPGDELLGFSAALLAMGTRTIVASVVPIPDAAARRLMIAFHRALVAGSSPSVALARAQAGLRNDLTALAGFVCLGAG